MLHWLKREKAPVYVCYECGSERLTRTVPMRCMDCGGALAKKKYETNVPRVYSTSGKLRDDADCDAAFARVMKSFMDSACQKREPLFVSGTRASSPAGFTTTFPPE